MRKFFLLFLILTIAIFAKSFAQDTLPKISVKKINNQIIISWKNNYGAKISNINIQRSYDSIKNFITIGSVLNPLNKENGFVDHRAPSSDMFYRVFVAFEGGNYLFSGSHKPQIDIPKKEETDTTYQQVFDFTKRPEIDSSQKQEIDSSQKQEIDSSQKQEIDSSQKQEIDNYTSKQLIDNLKKKIIAKPQKQEISKPQKPKIDFVQKKEMDILILNMEPPVIEKDLIPAKKFPKIITPAGFIPSRFIYTNKDNNLILSIPDADKENFSLLVFDDKDRQVFKLKKINEPYLIVEKVNFLHTGWFYYHLYNDDILLEKYKFYIGKDGRVGPPPPETKKTTTKGKN